MRQLGKECLAGLLMAAAAMLSACGGDSGKAGSASKSLQGVVRSADGAAVEAATVRLLTPAGSLQATTVTDAAGGYRFDVASAQYTVQATRRQAGARSRSVALVDLRAPGEGRVPDIVLPNLLANELPLIQGQAASDRVRIGGLPDQVERIWVQPGDARQRDLFPGEAFTRDEAFEPLAYGWFAAADAAGEPVTAFEPPLLVRMVLDDDARARVTDAEDGTDRIEVAMLSFNADLGLWDTEADGWLVDGNDQLIAESELPAINAGSYGGVVQLQFAAPHFSAYSAALFFRAGLPDFSDANAAPQRKHLRPQIAFNTGARFNDMWLGQSVSGEESPRFGDSADDGLVTCGRQTWVRLSQQVANGAQPGTGFLNVFQHFGQLLDVEGGSGDPDVRFVAGDRTVENLPITDWQNPWGPVKVAFVQIGDATDETGLGDIGLSGNHRSGYTRLMLTREPLTEQQLESATTFEWGETEDYLSDCSYVLRVRTDGEAEDRVEVRDLSCTPEDDCRTTVANGSSVELRALRNGAPIDVDWSLSSRLADVPACARGSTCQFERQDSGLISLETRGAQGSVSAHFPAYPEVLISVRGRGLVRELGDALVCDARDPAQLPGAEACGAEFPGASAVTLQAEPADQFIFAGWAPHACAEGTQLDSQCTVSLQGGALLRQRATFTAFPVLTVSPGAGGRVHSTPAGIDCDGDDPANSVCRAAFMPGTSLQLRAEPPDGAGVQSWTGACAGTSGTHCVLTLSEDQSVAVNFAAAAPLTVTVQSQGRVSSTPSGVDCTAAGGDCEQAFVLGSTVRLLAVPAADHGLLRWGEDCSRFVSSAECELTMDQARHASAQFGELFDARVTVLGNGSVDGPGISGCEAAEAGTDVCVETYIEGRIVEFTAQALAGNRFLGWAGDCEAAGTDARCRLTVSGDLQVEARFGQVQAQHRLTLSVLGTGGGAGDNDELLFCDTSTSPCHQDYTEGSELLLFAVPNDSSHSYRWSDDCIGTSDDSNCTISNINRAINVSVEFFDPGANADQPTLTVHLDGSGEGMVSDDQFKLTCNSGADPCSANYPAGTSVSLSATPASTADEFVGWTSPSACTRNAGNSSCTLTLSADTDVRAEFRSTGN